MKKVIAILLILSMALSLSACKSSDYKEAMELYEDERYERARGIFAELGEYKDSAEMVLACDYQQALLYLDDGEYSQAQELFVALGDYEDSAEMARECDYRQATDWMKAGDYAQARELFAKLGDYQNSAEMVRQCDYQQALACLDQGEYEQARAMLLTLGDYEDSQILAATAARGMFIDFLKENGNFEQKAGASDVLAVGENNGKLMAAYVMDISGSGINMYVAIGVQIELDGTATLVGTEDISSYAADWEAEATSDFDIAGYQSGDELTWDNLDASGYSANGTVTASEPTLMIKIMQTGMVKSVVTYLEEALAESGLGLTMADIGFTSY